MKTKHHPGTILERTVNSYSKKVAARDNEPERQYDYAQLRTAMKHLMPENSRLKAEVKRLKQENALLQKRLQALIDTAAPKRS
jgi:predicted nuclease with TOPRIM domain